MRLPSGCGALINRSLSAGIFAANRNGRVVIGVLGGWLSKSQVPALARSFLSTGIIGGFTTFTPFGRRSLAFIYRGDQGLAHVYVGVAYLLVLLLFGGVFGLRLGPRLKRSSALMPFSVPANSGNLRNVCAKVRMKRLL